MSYFSDIKISARHMSKRSLFRVLPYGRVPDVKPLQPRKRCVEGSTRVPKTKQKNRPECAYLSVSVPAPVAYPRLLQPAVPTVVSSYSGDGVGGPLANR